MKTQTIVAMLLCIQSGLSSAQTQPKAAECPVSVSRDELQKELSRITFRAIEAIKSGQPERLMPLFSSTGVEVGVDGPKMSLGSIRNEMSGRTGIYCLIFDSSCLATEMNAGRKKAGLSSFDGEILSYRDYLMKKRPAVRAKLWAISQRCGGSATTEDTYIDLEFQRQVDGWRITAIPYL
jgi:hypothetical protein